MLSIELSLLAGAVMTWPIRPGVGRLRAVGLRPTNRVALRVPRPRDVRTTAWVLLGALVAVTCLLGGGGVAVAVGAAGGTCLWRWQARRAQRTQLAAAAGMAEALRGLVAELRAGAHAATAAEGAAMDVRGAAADVLSAVASAARLGGDVGETLRTISATAGLGQTLHPLACAWELAQRYGLPLADVLDAVRRDLDGRVRFARQVHARMAGPRASGAVLGVLPVVAVLLGEAMGADPLHVLLATWVGQALLAVGTVLACAGMLWIAKLTSGAVRP